MKKVKGKIDLHLHLDGAIRPETSWELAHEQGIALKTEDFEEFKKSIIASDSITSVNEYLELFDLPVKILQDAQSLQRVTYELIETLYQQGLTYAEIRFAPQLHTKKGMTQADAIEAVLAGKKKAEETYPQMKTGILLCAMCIGPDTVNAKENMLTAELSGKYLGQGVVGFDLAGAEGIVPLSNFRPIFDKAISLGVPCTCHAGDSQGPDTVRDAISFGVKRIGHGHHIYDDPELVQLAIKKGITLEICPTSNIQCLSQPSYEEHPAKKLFDQGLRVTINTDNMVIAGVTLDDEYEHCVKEMGFTEDDIRTMLGYSADAAFIDEDTKAILHSAIE